MRPIAGSPRPRQAGSRRWTRTARALSLAGALSAALWLAGPAAAQTPEAEPVPVEAREVEVGTVAQDVSAVGSLMSNESVIIRPEIAGRIVGIHFAEGGRVEAGARLFSIDDSIYRAELTEAEASLRLSERNYARADELFQRGSGTARARDEAVAKLQTDRAALALVRARLDKTQIVAPFEGIVGLRNVSVGDYVTPGQDLVNLEDVDPVKVDFRVPERYLAALAKGQRLVIQVDAFPGRAFEGEVYALDPRIDVAGRSVAIRATVPNDDGLLRPGLFARVRLTVEARENAITIPEQAIVPRGQDRFVFKVVDGKAVMTKVTLGLRRTGEVEVVEGLAPGDLVVTAGQLKIRDGSPVEIVEAGPGT